MLEKSLSTTGFAIATALADLGRYRTVRVVGEGGMGRVHLAEEMATGRRVAVKVLRRELMGRPELVEQFQQTGAAVHALSHPNLAGVLESGTLADGRPYLVMEYLQGRDLRTLMGDTPAFDYPRVIDLMRQVCAGLGALHDAGIVHLDVKPSNIFLERGSDGSDVVKVLDFGIAVSAISQAVALGPTLLTGGTGRHGVTWLPLGAPEYWSPEQAMGKPVDGRSDLYSLGAVIYELLTGATPFGSHTFSELIEQHVHLAPRPLQQPFGLPVIPDELKALVLRCLAKAPEKRFQRAQDLAAALAEIPPPTAVAPPAPGYARASPYAATGEFPVVSPRGRSRRRLAVAVAIGCAGALAVATGLLLGRVRPAPPRPPAALAAGADARVNLSVSSEPPGAGVYVAESGALLARTPATVALPRGGRALELLFKFGDGQERRASVVPDRASQVHVQATRSGPRIP